MHEKRPIPESCTKIETPCGDNKKSPFVSKETHLCQMRPIKETHMHGEKPIKETNIHEKRPIPESDTKIEKP